VISYASMPIVTNRKISGQITLKMLSYNKMKRLAALLLSLLAIATTSMPVYAVETAKMGIHILNTTELQQAKELVALEDSEAWHYMTIPFTLSDIEKEKEWQAFFDAAREEKVIPLVRLTTSAENGAWKVPNKREITQQIAVLSRLTWPTDARHIIVFNEVNHAKEWGGNIDPAEYAEILSFTKNWANTEGKNYVVLPAAMDLAAPNGSATREAFSYMTAMYAADPEVFTGLGGWNSHSYPNPAFSASPQAKGKNTLRGYEYELAFLKGKAERDLPVYITETGWEDSAKTSRWLTSYYQYALQHIWSDPRIVAVTPFVFKGDPGPFTRFSFVKGDNTPTRQYSALQAALRQVQAKSTASSQ
jgi:hypothetical protein